MLLSLSSLLLISNLGPAPAESSTGLAAVTHGVQDAAPEAKPAPKWTGSVSVGAIIQEGNTDTRNANATADAEYRREKDRWTLGFQWNYSEQKSAGEWDITSRRTYGKAKYDYFLAEKSYLWGQVSGENNFTADLNLRTILGAGSGFQVKEQEDLKVSAELGVSLFDDDFDVAEDDSYTSARAAYKVDWAVSPKIGFLQDTEMYPSLEEVDDFYAKADSRAKVTLTEKMFSQLQWVLSYDNTPAAGTDRVDNLYALSVGWSF
jgi:putative salt-induced outer membrane protein YdiY